MGVRHRESHPFSETYGPRTRKQKPAHSVPSRSHLRPNRGQKLPVDLAAISDPHLDKSEIEWVHCAPPRPPVGKKKKPIKGTHTSSRPHWGKDTAEEIETKASQTWPGIQISWRSIRGSHLGPPLRPHKVAQTHIYRIPSYPPPCDIFARNEPIFIFSISNPRNSQNDPKLVSIVIIGKFCPFLAILDFFDSYHALSTLCKLKNLRLIFWPFLHQKWSKLHILELEFWVKKSF